MIMINPAEVRGAGGEPRVEAAQQLHHQGLRGGGQAGSPAHSHAHRDAQVLPQKLQFLEQRTVSRSCPACWGEKGQRARDGRPVPTWPELAWNS